MPVEIRGFSDGFEGQLIIVFLVPVNDRAIIKNSGVIRLADNNDIRSQTSVSKAIALIRTATYNGVKSV
jgi:hypothetical protein